MAGRWRALAAGVELFALALLGLAGFAVVVASFVPGFGLGMLFLLPKPIMWGRALTGLVRRRTAALTGVTINTPYLPPPPPPAPGPDGWYRRDRVLYRKPRVPAFMDRLEGLLGDNATWRDLFWMMLAPLTSGLLAVLPLIWIVAGIVLPFLGHPWAVLLIVVGFLNAPYGVQGAAMFNRRLLGGPLFRSDVDVTRRAHHPIRAWAARDLIPVFRLAVLLFTSALALCAFALTVAGLALGYGLGLIFVIPWALADLRWLADWRRSLARWSGLTIPSPYRQPPALVRDDEGFYRSGKSLYRTLRWALWSQRFLAITNDPATWREVAWRGLDPLIGGILAGVPAALFGYGVWGLVLPRITQTVFRQPGADWHGAVDGNVWLAIPVGLVLAFLAIKLAPAALRWHGKWTRLLLKPSAGTVLAQRVEQLTQTRADASAASARELRRIERDLHDGAQARLVAVGMALATVERLMETDPPAARELLGKTRESAAVALRELRQVVRGIHPPVLAERGLGDAVRAMALDSPLSTQVSVNLPRLPDPIEAAAYFAVAEALGNAARHSGATRATVLLELTETALLIVVGDNGRGGADPAQGSGLRGLAERLGIFDGTITVSSPVGGPTELTMEIPCASFSPRTSSS